ncbi:helix-turn-helix domain-containing protein [Candidatus Berkelbacteria bacterium]|nr:helix-turn-helix domain-containing protein [Candidatus Berkelbacteria bacterium]
MTPFRKKRIASSQTLGAKLLKARKRRHIELRTAETETKVPMRHLEALELGHYHKLPARVYVRGFLTRYAVYLGLKPESALTAYEVELASYVQTQSVRVSAKTQATLLRPHSADELIERRRQWHITPEIIWGSALSLFVLGVLGYMWFQVASFAAAPPLEIVTPGSALSVSVQEVEVAGITDPGAELRINDQPVTVNQDGHFREAVSLIDGVNTIEIAAKNKAEKETIKTLQLLADIPR